ncbi:MAG TPA: polyphosphate kinase 2 family protein [Aggregatilineales bacterium]|nr:polyphosphate kinase 2 family protein [Aggregatilineales bacterium]
MPKDLTLTPDPGDKIRLKDFPPDYTGDYTHEGHAADRIEKDLLQLQALQDVLYADGSKALLIILQGIDASGKDGTIKHVFRGLNPQGVVVTSFKQPSTEESRHDFLWRIHQHIPARGTIGVFNRSHYEDVLIVRVHDLVPKKVWKARYQQINDFEAMLADNDVTLLKFFLHISKDKQKERFEARRDLPDKRWKFSLSDLEERKRWDDYIDAYEAMLTECNSESAPWTIVPANHHWFRNLVVTDAIVKALKRMKLSYPEPIKGIEKTIIPD